ncbi:cupin domain-containing protein [Actinoplanes sp. LDG1-06]|uniref:Cupin domain-containing protein n=1 Tax=Paractinoplanes ovalisporus TaxID=2810368 RepID=A0ABS2AUZ0_9ACTN|nr:cupin domain-containing protein [Actinoplanes ovalisporus]MBM2623641.1 cupin domain-containing protein [Actinoplanes ovalisporus]
MKRPERVNDRTGRLTGRHGRVDLIELSPGQAVPEAVEGMESAVVVLTGRLSGLEAGAARFVRPGDRAGLVADPDGARALVVQARPAPESGRASSDLLDAGGGFADMRVRWLVGAGPSGSTALVVATSTFAADGRHELHRHASAEEFFLVVEGSGEHLTEFGPVRLGPGDAVLVPEGEWHGYRTDPGVTTRTIYGYLGAASLDDAGYEVRT